MASVPTSLVAIEILVVLLIAYRSFLNYRGRRVSVARLVAFPILVLFLYATAEASTAVTVPGSFPLWTAVDIALLLAAAAVTVPVARRLIRVYRGPDGTWQYRYGLELIGVYLGVWVVRLVLATYYDPNSLAFTVGPAPALSPGAADALQLVQALFSISSGLVIGRVIGTFRLYAEASRSSEDPRPLAPE